MLLGNVKRLCATMAASLVVASTFVQATSYEGQVNDRFGSCGCPPTHPRVDGCGSFFGEVDALFWRASECGLGYASKTRFSGSDCGTFNHTEIKNPNFRWDTGIRAGLGFTFECGWDVAAIWTHFQTRAHGHAANNSSTENAILFPAFGTGTGVNDPDLTFPGGPTTISAKWRLTLDLADLEMGRDFCIGPCVSLRPFVGVRGAWTKQTYHIVSRAPTTFDDSVFTNFSDVKLRNEFRGAGVRGGFDTEWHMGCGFSLYGNAAVSVLYGRTRAHSEENNLFRDSVYDEECDTVLFKQRDRWQGCRAITDVGLGIRWRQFFCCDSVGLTLAVGWEHHMFFNENRFEDFANTTSSITTGDLIGSSRSVQFTRGDLCLQGWTLSAKVEF